MKVNKACCVMRGLISSKQFMKCWCIKIIGCCLLFFSASCSTPYQSAGLTGGFSDTQLSPDIFRIFFRGNGLTPSDQAQDFAMLRAADLCQANGFSCFSVLDEHDSSSPYFYASKGDAVTVYKPRANLTIKGFKSKPDGNQTTFDVSFLQTSLRQKYHMK